MDKTVGIGFGKWARDVSGDGILLDMSASSHSSASFKFRSTVAV